MAPFSFKSPEDEALFLKTLNDVIIQTVHLPEDDNWHSVELRFDIICPKGLSGRLHVGKGGFMLGGSSAG